MDFTSVTPPIPSDDDVTTAYYDVTTDDDVIPDNVTLGPAFFFVEVPTYALVLTLIACVLSIIGSSIIIITYIIWKDLRTMSRHLLLCLALVDLIGALSFAYGAIRDFGEDNIECKVQSTLSTFSQTSSFLWTLSIAVYLYITIVWMNVELANRLGPVYHALSWGIPAVAVGVVLSFDGLGWDNSNLTVGWCWVNLQQEHAVVWMLLVGKLWEMLACVTLPVLCILMKLHIHKQRTYGPNFELSYSNPQVVAMVAMDRRLTILPLMFVALRVWGLVRFISYLSQSPLAVNWVLITLQGVAACSQGSANCILYFLLAKNVRLRLFHALKCRSKSDSKINNNPKLRCVPCRWWCYSVCACHCCELEYVQVNAENFYSDLAESSPLLHSARYE